MEKLFKRENYLKKIRGFYHDTMYNEISFILIWIAENTERSKQKTNSRN